MDSVYVFTQNPPENLSEKEMVLSKPTFLEEIKACSRRKGFSATLGPNYLRAIAEEIGRRYDKYFNAYRHVVPQDFMGRVAETDEQVAEVIHEMFQARYPAIYQRYYESVLRSRPFTTKVIYFTGSADDVTVFKRLGIDQINENQILDHLGINKSLKKQTQKLEKQQKESSVSEVKKQEMENSSKELELLASLDNSNLPLIKEPHAKEVVLQNKKPQQVSPQQVSPQQVGPQQVRTTDPKTTPVKEQLKTTQPTDPLRS